jgi:hypothetical protein
MGHVVIHDKARVEAIRARAVAQLELIKSLEAMIVKGKHAMLEVARNQTDDIETLFLSDLDRQERTAAEEARWLSYAEHMLQTWSPYLKQTEEQFRKFGGSGIEVIGG